MTILKKTLIIVAAAIAVLLVAAYLWAVLPYTVMDEAREALQSNSKVEVTVGKDITFSPKAGSTGTGFILYPGTRVDSEAYSVLAQQIAAEGHLVVLAQMPLDLSVLQINRAEKIIEENPQVKKWAIGGHSMGGPMAAFFTENHPDLISGLIFLAAYPASDQDLSDLDIKVISLYGSEDLKATKEEIHAYEKYPADTKLVEVKGGNHAGFGHYGPQGGDGEALISREEQIRFLSGSIAKFLNLL